MTLLVFLIASLTETAARLTKMKQLDLAKYCTRLACNQHMPIA